MLSDGDSLTVKRKTIEHTINMDVIRVWLVRMFLYYNNVSLKCFGCSAEQICGTRGPVLLKRFPVLIYDGGPKNETDIPFCALPAYLKNYSAIPGPASHHCFSCKFGTGRVSLIFIRLYPAND